MATTDDTASAAGDVPTGNVYDKYETDNPVARLLMRGFHASVWKMFELADGKTVLDVGCGEGFLCSDLAERRPDLEILGVDLEDPELERHWNELSCANLTFEAGDAHRLDYDDDTFDIVTAFEVLEHLEYPGRALAEMARVSRTWLIVSVPREPLWRALNLARFAYVTDLGNTPGHLNHWSQRGFRRFVSQFADVRSIEAPLPWTMVLAEVR